MNKLITIFGIATSANGLLAMTRAGIILLAMSLLLIFLSKSHAGSVTLTTYYPAPQGAYDRLALIPQTPLMPCTIGTILSEQSTGKLLYCGDDGTGSGLWGPLSGVWTQASDNVFPSATSVNANIFVGIGTSTPEFKLTLENDGGILAMGEFGLGQLLSDLYSGGSGNVDGYLIWYPRKASFRAGGLYDNGPAGGLWDDGSTGAYSAALGQSSVASGLASAAFGRANYARGDYSVALGNGYAAASGNHSVVINTAPVYSGVTPPDPALLSFSSGNFSVLLNGGVNSGFSTANDTVVNGQGMAVSIGVTIGGGVDNNFTAPCVFGVACTGLGGLYSTIAGGTSNKSGGDYSTIGGGSTNTAWGNYATIGGGLNNTASSTHSFIGGGNTNSAWGNYATVTGGFSNDANGRWGIINGGRDHTTSDMGLYASIVGGVGNTADRSSFAAGESNTMSGSTTNSVIANGKTNSIFSSTYTWVGGAHMVTPSGTGATRSFIWGYSAVTDVSFTQSESFVVNSGKVGIGQTVPSAILDIRGTGADDYLALTSTLVATPGDILIMKGGAGTNAGFLGIGQSNPQYPLEFGPQANGAHLTVGGVWTTISSRKLKNNIKPLDTTQALEATAKLQPVTYNYKVDHDSRHVGFIAEDVPDLVAAAGRQSVDPMNVVAVLTAVVKEQKKEIQEQENILKMLKNKLQKLENQLYTQ